MGLHQTPFCPHRPSKGTKSVAVNPNSTAPSLSYLGFSAPCDLLSHFLFLFSCGLILLVTAQRFSEFFQTLVPPGPSSLPGPCLLLFRTTSSFLVSDAASLISCNKFRQCSLCPSKDCAWPGEGLSLGNQTSYLTTGLSKTTLPRFPIDSCI